MKPSIPPVLITFALIFALVQNTQAVSPPPDGGYGPPAYGTGNTAEGDGALLGLTFGRFNTATGYFSLKSNTFGNFNTAIGAQALQNSIEGLENTAIGYDALFSNTTGERNTAIGSNALLFNTFGSDNTAIGRFALPHNTGRNNTAIGGGALFNNTIGSFNVAIGNTAGLNNTSGGSNIFIGNAAGAAVTTAIDVICIGVSGANVNNSCYIGSIFGQTSSGGSAVFINASGKLGTVTSSQRFKDDIKPMDKASETLFALKPVSFRYKKEIDPTGTSQFGLVAEDVEKVNRDLVVRDKEGKPYSVRYEAVNAMLLNEFLKEHHQVQDLKVTVAEQQKQIEALTATVQKVSAQLEVNKPAPQTVLNNQ
jgi:Chaperone of endosialidase